MTVEKTNTTRTYQTLPFPNTDHRWVPSFHIIPIPLYLYTSILLYLHTSITLFLYCTIRLYLLYPYTSIPLSLSLSPHIYIYIHIYVYTHPYFCLNISVHFPQKHLSNSNHQFLPIFDIPQAMPTLRQCEHAVAAWIWGSSVCSFSPVESTKHGDINGIDHEAIMKQLDITNRLKWTIYSRGFTSGNIYWEYLPIWIWGIYSESIYFHYILLF